MKRNSIIIVSILLILILLCIIFLYNYTINQIHDNDRVIVSLDKCVDGDTAWFKVGKNTRKYRFLAIDSPEVNDNYGQLSKDYVCDLLNNASKIEIEYDLVGNTVDKYDRELVWVYVDDELIQKKLLEKGYSKIKYVYANYKYLDNLYLVENNAKENRLGIWNNYSYKVYNVYYTVTFDYINKSVSVLKNNMIDLIDNPYKDGCRFIGWRNGNYLFDLSTKISKNYNLKAEFDC